MHHRQNVTVDCLDRLIVGELASIAFPGDSCVDTGVDVFVDHLVAIHMEDEPFLVPGGTVISHDPHGFSSIAQQAVEIAKMNFLGEELALLVRNRAAMNEDDYERIVHLRITKAVSDGVKYAVRHSPTLRILGRVAV